MPQKTTSKSVSKVKYENNPFFIAGNGITLLFDLARGVGVLLLALSIISFMLSGRPNDDGNETEWESAVNTVSSWSLNDWILAIGATVIIGMAILLVSALVGGISSYTSWRLSQGKKVKLNEAFHEAFDNLWSYLWLQIVMGVKILLWSLLFILPGIYFAFRYSLAGVAFFDDKKNLRGDAAIKESLRLTKGAWLTTFSANTLFNILTFGILSGVVATSVNTVLYRQFDALGSKSKPVAHWLSWITLILPLIFLFFVFALLIALATGIAIGGTLVS